VAVRQTRDGLVTVERAVAGGQLLLRTLPNNRKVRFEGQQVQVTASLGEERLLSQRFEAN
jgi:hypothetical protein